MFMFSKIGKLQIIAAVAMTSVVSLSSVAFAQSISIVVNNVGYEATGPKRAIVQSSGSLASVTDFEIINTSGVKVGGGTLGEQQRSAQWGGTNEFGDGFGNFKVADFSAFNSIGEYRVKVGTVTSSVFSIGTKVLQKKTGADQVGFFYGMRYTESGDAGLPIRGSTGTHNIYGGWWDATGDPGKHLSHLAYSNYFTPQQIPMVVWALLHADEVQPGEFDMSLSQTARAEAAWGADYLLRALSSAGYFYMSVFDDWGNAPGTREICAWGSLEGINNDFITDGTFNSEGERSSDYQSALREGGGVSIAALARAAKAGISGDSSSTQYLEGAKRAYKHLVGDGNYKVYPDDKTPNIIDFYTGLLAATELYNATQDNYYLSQAHDWVDSLISLQSSAGWFKSGNDAYGSKRPFYHAAEEGFPVVALARFHQVSSNAGKTEKLGLVIGAIDKNLRWYKDLTYNTGANPFEYAKMYRAPRPPLSGASGGGGPSGAVDVARGKYATASREESNGNCGGTGCPAAYAVDGNPSTRWSSYQSGENVDNDNQWIVIDLGNTHIIDSVVLRWERAHGKSYTIDVSTNGTSWTTVVSITDNSIYNDRLTHRFPASREATHVRMNGLVRGNTDGGFSLFDFEVYGKEKEDNSGNVTLPSYADSAYFFIPKDNETGYWWQGENARLASLASAFILGAPMVGNIVNTAQMWNDAFFPMATAQLDWILGKNPFDLTMMYGYSGRRQSDPSYTEYPRYKAAALANINGGICNGISSMRTNENNIEWMPYGMEPYSEYPHWMNWRYMEQWLPHNAWYLVAISSLSERIENGLQPVSIRHNGNIVAAKQYRMKVSVGRNRTVRMTLPFAADHRTEVAVYNMQGKKIFKQSIKEGSRSVSMKIPPSVARGVYVLSVKDAAGKNRVSDRIHLK